MILKGKKVSDLWMSQNLTQESFVFSFLAGKMFFGQCLQLNQSDVTILADELEFVG